MHKSVTNLHAATAMTLLMIAIPARATSVLNGSFSNVGTATSSFSISLDTTLPNWVATPTGNQILDCLIFAGATTNLCGTTAFGGGLTFWQFPGASPDGGNYVAVDGASAFSTALTQNLTGLVTGQKYNVTFYQAATQQSGFTGLNTEQWQVSLGGGPSQLSTLMNNASMGDVGWMQQSLTFTATAATQALTFVAKGTPSGQPPFVLLDGVSIQAVPEPGTLAMIGVGLLGVPIVGNVWKKRV
jgi:PEP-CTERM motif